ETPIDAGGGHSMIVDYRGAIVGKQPYTNASDLRRRPDQYRGAAPSPANGAGHQLDEGHSRRAGAADLRAADLSQEPLRRPRSRPSRRLPQGSHRATGPADAGTRDLEGSVASRVVRDSVRPGGAIVSGRARAVRNGPPQYTRAL